MAAAWRVRGVFGGPHDGAGAGTVSERGTPDRPPERGRFTVAALLLRPAASVALSSPPWLPRWECSSDDARDARQSAVDGPPAPCGPGHADAPLAAEERARGGRAARLRAGQPSRLLRKLRGHAER